MPCPESPSCSRRFLEVSRWQPLTFRESVGRFKSNDKFIPNRLFNRLGGQALRYILAHRLAARNRRLAGIPRDEREQRLLDEGILVIENFLPPDIFEKVKAENAYADEDPRLRKAGPDLQGVVLYNANISPKTHPFTTERITEADEVRRLMSVFDGIVEGKEQREGEDSERLRAQRARAGRGRAENALGEARNRRQLPPRLVHADY